MNRFVTGNGAPRTPERAEMLARVDPTLDRPVILFQDIIEILHGAMLAVVGQIACGLEHGNGGWISGVLVAIDDPRLRMVLNAQGFTIYLGHAVTELRVQGEVLPDTLLAHIGHS